MTLGYYMKKIIPLSIILLSGCMSSVQDAREYNGQDSSYHSRYSADVTATCIKTKWQDVYVADPSKIWLTKPDNNGIYSVYAASFLYLADVKDDIKGSSVTYYNNGDRLWGTKEKMIQGIKSCL